MGTRRSDAGSAAALATAVVALVGLLTVVVTAGQSWRRGSSDTPSDRITSTSTNASSTTTPRITTTTMPPRAPRIPIEKFHNLEEAALLPAVIVFDPSTGCIFSEAVASKARNLLVWPPGFEVETDPVRVTNGTVTITAGEHVSGGGGERDATYLDDSWRGCAPLGTHVFLISDIGPVAPS